MSDYTTTIQIDAPPAIVFARLVTSEGMVEWMGQRAELDATPGGLFSVDINGEQIRGTFLEVEPPRRVVVTWGVVGNGEHPAASSRVEFTLTACEGGTRVALLHTELPASRAEMHARGWGHFLARLRVAAMRGDPGPDPFTPEPALERS